MNFSELSDAIKCGRDIVLREYGLDPSAVNAIAGDDQKLINMIEKRPNRDKSKDNYLIALAKNKYMPKEMPDKGIAFTPFYNKAQTSGDSAEVSLYLLERARGHNVKREVSTPILEKRKFNLFGYEEEIKIRDRKSDLVVEHEDGTNTHIELKVGLTANNKLSNLRQELYGDCDRLERNPNTSQQYAIFRNGLNGLSQQDSKEYMAYLAAMQERFGEDRVKINIEGKYISNPKESYTRKKIEQKSVAPQEDLIIKGERCSIGNKAINPEIDQNIRAVNNCADLPKQEEFASVFDSRSKVSNFKRAYEIEPSPSAKFLAGFKGGAVEGAKYGFVYSSVDALVKLMGDPNYRGKNGEGAVCDIIEGTAKSAIRSGLIAGASNLGKTLTGKKALGFVAGTLMDSAGSFFDFCTGKIGADDLLTNVLGNAIVSGGKLVARKAATSFINKFLSIGGGGKITGTSKLFRFMANPLKIVGLAFVGAAIFSLLFKSGDENARVNLDPRVSIRVEIDRNGKCVIDSGMSNDAIETLIRYNQKVDELNRISSQLQKKEIALRKEEIEQKNRAIQSLQEEIEYLRQETIRQAKKISLMKSDDYRIEIEGLIASHLEKGLVILNKQNIKIQEIQERKQVLFDEQKQCEYISSCCKQIIKLGQGELFKNEMVKDMVKCMADVASNNSFSYISNMFTTGADILRGCLGGIA